MKTVSEKYSRLTFILSVIGFIGSLGFYFGVLREVYSEENSMEVIEQLQSENRQLKAQINILIEEKKNDH